MKTQSATLPILALTLILSACTSAPMLPLTRLTGEMQGEIFVYRESAFAAGGLAVNIGVNGKSFAKLSNSEFVRAQLPVGKHDIFVQARTAEASKVSITVAQNKPLCLRTSASSSTYVKVAVPMALMLTGYHFYLEEVSCPSKDELAKYKEVLVTYQ
jgi:hypothetical protein